MAWVVVSLDILWVTSPLKACSNLGLTPSRLLMESEWKVFKTWLRVSSSFAVRLESVQNMTKGFFLFCFSDPANAPNILAKQATWYVRNSLLVLTPWHKDFVVSEWTALKVPVWVELPGLPLPCVSFLSQIAASLGRVVCLEADRFYHARLQKRVCVEIDLSQDLKEFVDIHSAGYVYQSA